MLLSSRLCLKYTWLYALQYTLNNYIYINKNLLYIIIYQFEIIEISFLETKYNLKAMTN